MINKIAHQRQLQLLWYIGAASALCAILTSLHAAPLSAQTDPIENTIEDSVPTLAPETASSEEILKPFSAPRVKPSLSPDAPIDQSTQTPARTPVESVPASPEVQFNAPTNRFPDFAAIRNNTPVADFFDQESTYLTALQTDKDHHHQHRSALAFLYMAYDYHAEASVHLNILLGDLPRDRLDQSGIFSASALNAFYLRRYDDIMRSKNLEQIPVALPLKAMALSREGHHQKAWPYFLQLEGEQSLPSDLQGAYWLARTQTAIELGEIKAAQRAIGNLNGLTLNAHDKNHRQYLLGKLSGNNVVANTNANTNTNDASAPTNARSDKWAALSALDDISDQLASGAITTQMAAEKLDGLQYADDGRAFMRRWQEMKVDISHAQQDYPAAFATGRDLLAFFEDSDSAIRVQQNLREMLATLFDDDDALPLLEATQIVYENIDLLEPGAKGDAQIRTLVDRLVALDLLDEAAELLEHQVFQRLRGNERARVAASLASIYIDNHKPDDALRVIAQTRITGLDDIVRNQRREIEATALWKTGRHDKALARLSIGDEVALPTSTQYLRGQIDLDMGNFLQAGEILGALAEQRLTLLAKTPEAQNASLSRDDELLILQAAAAHARANNLSAIGVIFSLMQEHDNAHPVTSLLATLVRDGNPAAFLTAYRHWLDSNV